MNPDIAAAIERALKTRVLSARAIGGGDINEAFCVELESRGRAFVKFNRRAPDGMFEAEAHGLEWLRAAKAISVPEVLAVGANFLLLEWLEASSPRRNFDDVFGRGLAALHRFGAPSFGLERDNFIGRLPQSNRQCSGFREFYADQRLRIQFDRARRSGHFDAHFALRFEDFVERMSDYLGPDEPPARLHGDLWSGNYLVDVHGEPWLFDPAAYGGHREMDLAMMRLFGGFSERVFDAYNEAYPFAPGFRERIALMQLYPLLVHVNLFGGGYATSVCRIVDEYLR